MKTTIKKFSLIAILFMSIGFFSCEKQDEQEMFDRIDDEVENVYSEEKDKKADID